MLPIILITLLAYCGGPLLLNDALLVHVGQPWAFALSFAPMFSLCMGAMSCLDPVESSLGRLFRSSGLLAVVLLAAVDGWAVHELLLGNVSHNLGLHWLGVLAGLLACIGYLQLWSRGHSALLVFGAHTGEIAAFAGSLLFTLLGLVLLPLNPEVGGLCALFFGACSLVCGHALWIERNPGHRQDFAELAPAQQRQRRLVYGTCLALVGVAMTVGSPSFPLVFRVTTALMGLMGLALIVRGLLPAKQQWHDGAGEPDERQNAD